MTRTPRTVTNIKASICFDDSLGSPAEKKPIPVTYVWISDDDAPLRLELKGTWYDSRKKQKHRDPEYRLYYPKAAEDVVYKAKPGDTLLFCLPKNGPLLAISCPAGSTIERQLLWLFGLSRAEEFKDSQHDLRSEKGAELDYTARYILALIEVEVTVSEDEWLERLLKKFGATFPSTTSFSKFARETIKDIDALNDPDECILKWIDFEERLFRTLERHVVGDRLKAGFMDARVADVDGFVKFSLSVQNRRKARAGAALEHHLAAVFDANSLKYVRSAETENRNKPDFLFPSIKEYCNKEFPEARLTMLAAKSTCKDRWRQALSEAKRIRKKHLITLEPGISKNQTDEMKAKQLGLVLPAALHRTYQPSQASWLLNLKDFILLVKDRQK